MLKNKLSKKIIILISIIILVILIFTIFVFVDIQNRNNNIAKLENDLLNQDQKNQYLVSMNNIVKDADNSIDKINKSILAFESDVLIIEKIENLAQKNGLEISIDTISVEDVPLVYQNGLTTLKIKAKTIGGWVGTYKFINDLESMEEKIRFEKLILNTEKKENIGQNISSDWQAIFEIRFLKLKNN